MKRSETEVRGQNCVTFGRGQAGVVTMTDVLTERVAECR